MIPVKGLTMPTRWEAYLVGWIDVNEARMRFEDAGIYSEASPTIAIGVGHRPILIAKTVSSVSYDRAASRMRELVAESPLLSWVIGCKAYQAMLRVPGTR